MLTKCKYDIDIFTAVVVIIANIVSSVCDTAPIDGIGKAELLVSAYYNPAVTDSRQRMQSK